MARPDYNTRDLTREAAPHILRSGRNLTTTAVREYIRRHHPGLADANPSETTIADELVKVRKEIAALAFGHTDNEKAAMMPALPAQIVGKCSTLLEQMLAHAREEAAAELAAHKADLDRKAAESEARTGEAERAAAAAAQQLADELARFTEETQRLQGALEATTTQAEDLGRQLDDRNLTISSLTATVAEKAQQVALMQTTLDEATRRLEDQVGLAEARYRDLERAKLLELDSMRTQRDRAYQDLDAARNSVTMLTAQNEELMRSTSRLDGEMAATLRQVSELKSERQDLSSALKRTERELDAMRNALETSEARYAAKEAECQELRTGTGKAPADVAGAPASQVSSAPPAEEAAKDATSSEPTAAATDSKLSPGYSE